MTYAPTVVDLFCGAGGLSLGFQQAGYKILAGQDIDEIAGQTFSQSHPKASFLPGPIQSISADQIFKATSLKKSALDVLVGGPPCQGYSYYNHNRGVSDPRAGLFREYLRIVADLNPKWIVMENVAGITSISSGGIVREIYQGLNDLGYRVDHKLLKAEEFGVPQERRRMIFIGTRTDEDICFPKASFDGDEVPYINIWDAIADLPSLKNGERKESYAYRHAAKNAFQAEMRSASDIVRNHYAAKLSQVNEERLRFIPPGGSWRDIPFDLLPNGMKRAKRSDHTKRYGRPRKTDLSGTVLTKCDIHWGAYIHPTQDRAFSVREAARLQSFPDDVIFAGSMTDQYVQVGNAVPPRLARALADCLRGFVVGSSKPSRVEAA